MEKKTNLKQIENRLRELLFGRETPYCIAISGEWGVGKTYFWKDFVETCKSEFKRQSGLNHVPREVLIDCETPKANTDKFAYISLFGKENLKAIEEEIFVQVSKLKQFAKKYKPFEFLSKVVEKFAKGSSIVQITISSVISLLDKEYFKNVIVCFDDFERMSDKINKKDIFGLIAKLKEDRECKVVMIFNDKVVDFGEAKQYKDKLVDYEFKIDKSCVDPFEFVNGIYKDKKPSDIVAKQEKMLSEDLSNEIKNFFYNTRADLDFTLDEERFRNKMSERQPSNNIRIIQRVVNALLDYQDLINQIKSKPYKDATIQCIIVLAFVNAKYMVDFDGFFKFMEKYIKIYDELEEENNKSKQQHLNLNNFAKKLKEQFIEDIKDEKNQNYCQILHVIKYDYFNYWFYLDKYNSAEANDSCSDGYFPDKYSDGNNGEYKQKYKDENRIRFDLRIRSIFLNVANYLKSSIVDKEKFNDIVKDMNGI